jgi:TadE-like protein
VSRRRVRRERRERSERPAEQGSAVVDFVLVGTLATLVLVAVLQLAVVLHVRNTLIDCASQGARYGALADRNPGDGAVRAAASIRSDLSASYARDVTAGEEQVDGLRTVVVRVRAPLPVIGLLGVGRVLTVTGHALREGP